MHKKTLIAAIVCTALFATGVTTAQARLMANGLSMNALSYNGLHLNGHNTTVGNLSLKTLAQNPLAGKANTQ